VFIHQKYSDKIFEVFFRETDFFMKPLYKKRAANIGCKKRITNNFSRLLIHTAITFFPSF
jgi:hypothetical protein